MAENQPTPPTDDEKRLQELAPAAFEYLDLLFKHQAALNNRCVHKDQHQPIANLDAIYEDGPDSPLTVARVAYWATSYARALVHEAIEFEDCFPWKWWSSHRTIDMQNAKVELVDMLHFYISMCLVLRVKPSELISTYQKKLAVNHQRQDRGYDASKKTEDDNRTI